MDFTIAQSHGWKDGRRIVDLDELSRQMHCKHCKDLLDLNRILRETRYGLASVLSIMCQCGVINDVHTDRKQDSDVGRPMYEVNVKASINMLIYGMGAQNIVSFLQAVLEIPIPPPDDSSLILPAHPAPDATLLPVSLPTCNPSLNVPLNTPFHSQLHVPQHHLQMQQQQQQQHQQQHQQHQQQQQQQQQRHQQLQPQPQVLNIPQHKDMYRSLPVHDKGSGKGSEKEKASTYKCTLCRPCPHWAKTDNMQTDNRSVKKIPEKVKLTKDERDDLKVNTKCTVCKIVFRSREHYRMHKILHPQIRKKQRVKCPDCSAEFPDRGKLREHIKIHSGEEREKPFPCEQCSKAFYKKSQRSKHIKRCHMKENSHVCEICGKRTFTKSELREHVRIHTGERPYQCEVCDRTFRRKDYLTVHMRQHTGVKPYTCHHCGESFVQRVSLCKHLQTKHSVSTEGTMPPPPTTRHPPMLMNTVTQDAGVPAMPVLHGPVFYQ